MDYGEKIMRKYGWQKGKGLGRDEKGDTKPLKASLKFDRVGIGYNKKVSQETKNPWWVKMYNEAASKKENPSKKKSKRSPDETSQMNFNNLTDEELFAACGGRTAHKAARHGLKLNGKLERIRKQEIVVVSACEVAEVNEKVSVADESSPKKSKKRKVAGSNKQEEVGEPSPSPSVDLESSTGNEVSRKRRKLIVNEDVDHAEDTRAGEDVSCEQIGSKKKKKKGQKREKNVDS